MSEEMEAFSNFISLGSACQTASSMAKYGLRGWSGPFDWLVTDSLQWILHYMENDFEDFLRRENLERDQYNPKTFIDRESGFIFRHDYEYPFEEKYDELKRRYQKRIDRFQREVVNRTCFLRTVIDSEEIKYISENADYIHHVIKGKNSQNEIIFLIRKDVEVRELLPFRYYIMPGKWNGGPNAVIRNWFDQADEFLEYCVRNYDVMSLMRNIAFDREQQEKIYNIAQIRYRTLLKLMDCDVDNVCIPEKVIIYGTGNIGLKFYEKIKGKCEVICFIDKEKAGEKVDEIPIKRLEEVDYGERVSFIITPTYDFQNICKDIREYCEKAEIVSLDSILANG
ncbi:MAG: papain-like cysteine peptidase [Lachnospiraceae bacterium]|nr:papain-like cysteine peptidase [Lachnospiraceae bacterium]